MPNDSIGALWVKTSRNGLEYMSGTINGQEVVVYRNKYKNAAKHPDWRIYKSQPKGAARPQRTDDDIAF